MRAPALVLAAGLLAAPVAAWAAPAQAVFYNACGPHDQPALEIVVPADASAGSQLTTRIWGAALDGLQSGQFLMMMPTASTPHPVDKDIFLCDSLARCTEAKGQLRIGQYRPREFLDGELLWHDSSTVTSIPFAARFADHPTPCE